MLLVVVGISVSIATERVDSFFGLTFILSGMFAFHIAVSLSNSHTHVDITTDSMRIVDRCGRLQWFAALLREQLGLKPKLKS